MLGRLLFYKTDEQVKFNDLGNSFYSIFVLLTTANDPNVMMPAYNENGWYDK